MRHVGVKTVTRTVRDFKNFVEEETGTRTTLNFPELSEAHRKFWQKLNNIGARNMGTQPPNTVPDIDATVILEDQEWMVLEAEFRTLRRF
ncbi:MAG: hypothetical protein V4473_01460 [Patescibacteria group bacterium]